MADQILPGQAPVEFMQQIQIARKEIAEKRLQNKSERDETAERVKHINDRLLQQTGKPGTIRPLIIPEHYHLIYSVYEDGVMHSFPSYATAYPSPRLAYLEMKEKADLAAPQSEFYEDGMIMIETVLEGRSGLFRVYLSVGSCPGRKCGRVSRIVHPGAGIKLLPGTSLGRGKR